MDQYCFAFWRLSSSSVTLPAGGGDDTPWRASSFTSRRHLVSKCVSSFEYLCVMAVLLLFIILTDIF